jgi:hypothetical protein
MNVDALQRLGPRVAHKTMRFPGAYFKYGGQVFHPPKQLTIIDSTETQQEPFRCLFLQCEPVDGYDLDIALSPRSRDSFGI